MADVPHDLPGVATAAGGLVLLDEPDGTALAFTPSAAQATGESLIAAADEARAQLSRAA